MVDEWLKSFANFNSSKTYDEHASLITNFGFAGGQGSTFINNIDYTKPKKTLAIFEPLKKIPSSLHSTMRIATMTNIAREQGSYAKNRIRYVIFYVGLIEI